MDSYYDEKQHHREKELNSRRNSNQMDDRQYKNKGNKKLKLSRDANDSFQDTELQTLNSEISVSSDDGANDYIESLAKTTQKTENATSFVFSAITTMETLVNQLQDIADWITPVSELYITPLCQRYINFHAMMDECRQAKPVVDNTILHDLQRTFNNLLLFQLSKMIRCCQKLPYYIRSEDGQLNERARQFMLNHKLTEQQLAQVHHLGKEILFRSSYGVLFLQEDKFLAKTNPMNKKRRSAIKGYPILKQNEEWENPWETATRMTERDVQYCNSENEEWQWFNIDDHIQKDERQNYLECLITSVKNTELVRYIGLFVIRLKPNMRIRLSDYYQADNNENWYKINARMDSSTFYTIRPFLKYIQEHPEFA